MPSHLKRINQPGHIHFWTISCHRRLGFLHHDATKQAIVCALKHLQSKHAICLIGYVIMPDHVHVLLYPHAQGCDEPLDISTLLSAFKQHAGFHVKAALRQYWQGHGILWTPALTEWATSDRKGKRIWTTRGYDFNIDRHDTLLEKLDYCHKNPITRGLVERAEDWPWSSYRFYEMDDDSIIAMDWNGAWPIEW